MHGRVDKNTCLFLCPLHELLIVTISHLVVLNSLFASNIDLLVSFVHLSFEHSDSIAEKHTVLLYLLLDLVSFLVAHGGSQGVLREEFITDAFLSFIWSIKSITNRSMLFRQINHSITWE